jgi:hypothetical protein
VKTGMGMVSPELTKHGEIEEGGSRDKPLGEGSLTWRGRQSSGL